MGATASMLSWPDALCEGLARRGRFVIRYDNRDTGQSTTGLPGSPGYSIDDMADDALAVADGYGLQTVHLLGMSLGGMIAQLVALKAPHRVRTLTLLSTCAFDEDDPDLPGMDPAFLDHFAGLERLDWTNRAAAVAFQLESLRLAAGAGFDPVAGRDLAEREYDRARNPQSALNHGQLGGGKDWAGQLAQIIQPALVLHGRHDPILSFEHGKRLAAKLPDARFVALDSGHELNARDIPEIIEEVISHTA